MSAPLARAPSQVPEWGALPALLELLALCAFVVAQPVLDLLSEASELLIYRRAGPPEILLTAAVVTLLPPLALFALEAVTVRLVSPLAGSHLHRTLVAGLVGIFALQLLQARTSLPSFFVLCLTATAAFVAGVAYARWNAVRLWMRLASPAPVVFASLFLFTAPVSHLLGSPGRAMASQSHGQRVPIVVIILDELPLASLVDEQGTIDGRLYPNIAGLAQESTFFRNATAAAARTAHAVPAMLTGRFPTEARAPVSSQYPANLFALLAGSHDLKVFESVTGLCPRDACPDNAWGATSRRNLLRDAARIWTRTLARGRSGTVAVLSGSGPENLRADDAFFLLDRLHEDQTERFEAFIASIDGKGVPFHFIHALLPHAPWRYLPDGAQYDDRPLGMVDYERRTSEPWPAVVNRQRHILQTMAVDRLVGAALARLKEVGLYDRAAVLLTADHGISFAPAPPGATRNILHENQHEVAWVPFLLKTPGQTSGEVRDDNVMAVDLAPTVAALAGVRVPWDVDGISLLDGRRDSDAKASFNEPGQPFEVDPAGLARALEGGPSRMMDLDDEVGGPYVLRQVAELGRLDPAGGVEPDVPPMTARIDDLPAFERVGTPPHKLPALLTGHLLDGDGAEAPAAVVAVVNGSVVGASRLYAEGDQLYRFALMVDPRFVRPGTNSVELFAVDGEAEAASIRSVTVDG